MGSSPYMPKPVDVINAIEGTSEDRAMLAWALVVKAEGKYGVDFSIRFPHPAIHFAIEKMGGWRHLYRVLSDDNERFLARDFARLYAIGERCAAWENVCAYFPSVHESANRQRGFELARKVYDVETGALVPERELPALSAPVGTQAEGLIRLVAGDMGVAV